MIASPERRRDAEVWIAWVRLGGVVFALLEVGVFTKHYPRGYGPAAWAVAGVFAVGAVSLWLLSRRAFSTRVSVVAVLFDGAVITSFATIYSFEYGNLTRWALMFVVVEAALRFGLAGGVAIPVALLPFLAFVERWRADHFGGPGYYWDRVTFPFGVFLLTGVIVGTLVNRLGREAALAQSRASEAESLRDALSHRVDLLEAANRCARALGSSLDLDEAFGAFIDELGRIVPFERVTIVLVEGDRAEVMAAAGREVDRVFPPGTSRPVAGSVLEDVLEGRVVHRKSMRPPRYPEEEALLELGLESRLLAPLQLGPRTIGMLGLVRERAGSFAPEDVELVTLLGGIVATAVQNIRAYDAERKTVEELRRLSALRADFVSLVSHELRSPMAAVIGAARTLQGRWRELAADQRQAFLALIADETARLAALIADVLDTSRIEAGTFSYSFSDVDLGLIVGEVVAAAQVGQDEVSVHAEVDGHLPTVRGDGVRLRQVLQNLVDNAVKYSPANGVVRVAAGAENGAVRIAVLDDGPGIPTDDQRVIFEKFGRSVSSTGKPGTGLGLFIARSIAEAHGGSLEVASEPANGAAFTLTIPAGAEAT
jgi:signal transduction histidine kinase